MKIFLDIHKEKIIQGWNYWREFNKGLHPPAEDIAFCSGLLLYICRKRSHKIPKRCALPPVTGLIWETEGKMYTIKRFSYTYGTTYSLSCSCLGGWKPCNRLGRLKSPSEGAAILLQIIFSFIIYPFVSTGEDWNINRILPLILAKQGYAHS